MAEATNRKSLRLPPNVKRATLKPGKVGEGKNSALFAPADDNSDTERDFDKILQEVMASEDEGDTNLTDEEAAGTAAMARRLAERVLKERAAEGNGAEEPAAEEPASKPSVPAAARKEELEEGDDLAEPFDLQRLIQARESMSAPPPAQPYEPEAAEAEAPEAGDPAPTAKVEPLPKPQPKKKSKAKSEAKALLKRKARDSKPRSETKTDEPEQASKLPDDAELFAQRLAAMDGQDVILDSEREEDDTTGGGTGGTGTSPVLTATRLEEAPKENPLRGLAEAFTPLALWLSLAAMVGSLVYGTWIGGVDVVVAALLGSGLLIFATTLIVAGAVKAYSPLLLTGFLFKRMSNDADEAVALAGNDILQGLGLAEGIVDADADARLVTTRDGVVVYANDAYRKVAEEAGIRGATGLPPRMDRLFGQSSTESSKMFRLAKACRSGGAASEVLTQTMGRAARKGAGELPVRRFEVHVRPMRPLADGQPYAAWRLHELEVDHQQDQLKSAYFDFPRAVIALERSGSIAWINKAAANLFGTKPGQALALGDVALGETKPIVRALWEDNAEEYEVRIRQRGSTSLTASREVIFNPFTRGGTGEGFVVVEVAEKAQIQADPQNAPVGSDLQDVPFGVAVLEGDPSADAKVTYANTLFQQFFPNATDNARFNTVLPSGAISELNAALKSRPNTKPLTKPFEVRVGEGAQAHIFRVFARPVRRRRGGYGPRQTVLYAVDITYQRRMEEESTQAQKLQQIGQIAGSVAHDFNNLLVVVMGSTELLMRNHPVGDPSYKDLSMIYETAQRAQNLTRNLLAFSRKQTLKPEVCSITELLNDFTPALKRYVSEKVSLDVIHGRNIPEVKADKGQIHLAVMNLAVNARDAMPGGGTLRIETKHVKADEIADFGYEVLDEVDHVMVEVADTGGGVPKDIADKIFEPFFTTKGEGQGTGLGLSTVAGAIAQMGGRIFLFNRPGEGATFRIFLPTVSPEEAAAAAERRNQIVKREDDAATDPTGKGRILVVEDEDGVRSIVVRALGMCGYEIVEASDGDEALDIIETEDQRFDLILTDIMMPEMDGPTLIEEAGDKLKGAKVVFMSGYAEAAMRDKLNTIEGAKYLQKPFTLTGVAAVVKEALSAA